MAKDNTIILLAVGAAGVYAWYKGYLAQFGIPGPSSSSGTTLTAAQIAAIQQAQAAAGTASTTPSVPALGTTVTNASDALKQAAANDAFIIPDAATFSILQAAPPAGYGWIMTTDKGGILLRPDVLSAVQTAITNRVNRAVSQGAAASSIQQAGQVTLADIQQMMTTSGLTGLGEYRRHIFTRTGMVA